MSLIFFYQPNFLRSLLSNLKYFHAHQKLITQTLISKLQAHQFYTTTALHIHPLQILINLSTKNLTTNTNIFQYQIFNIQKPQPLQYIHYTAMNHDSPKRFNTTYRSTLQNSSISALTTNTDLERLLLEKQMNEERLIRELAYKEETLQLFQSEKNLKMDQYQIQVEEEILRLRRKFEAQIDDLNRKILERDRQIRNSLANYEQLELANNSLTHQFQLLNNQMLVIKEQNKILNNDRDKATNTIKLLEVQELKLKQQVADMEEEIVVLIQIQGDKSKQIALLQQNQRSFQQKYLTLQTQLIQLQSHIKLITQKIQIRQEDCQQLKFIIGKMDSQIQQKQLSVLRIQKQLQDAVRRQKIRQSEVKQLMCQNERVYGEWTKERHRLKDLAVQYKLVL